MRWVAASDVPAYGQLLDGVQERPLTMPELVSTCKHRGFVFPGSDLYGSVGTGYDYGPLGAQLKKNVQDLWWKDFVERRDDCVGLDSCILSNPRGMPS